MNQNYPNLEYLILDGGSTDSTLEILAKYQDKLTLISEKDNGQVDAINKGIKLSKGEIIAYLNSDDIYYPGTLNYIGNYFSSRSDVMAVTGRCKRIDKDDVEIDKFITLYKNFWLNYLNDKTIYLQQFISQPSTFWRRDIVDEIGYFDPQYKYAMDYDYWIRISKKYKIHFINQYLAGFRVHNQSITGQTNNKHLDEAAFITKQYSKPTYYFIHNFLNKFSSVMVKIIRQRKPV